MSAPATTSTRQERLGISRASKRHADPKKNDTRVTWEKGSRQIPIALRRGTSRSTPFVSAPRFSATTRPILHSSPCRATARSATPWPNFKLHRTTIDLDNAYPKIIVESWVVLTKARSTLNCTRPSASIVSSRARILRSSAKVTRITPDTTEHLSLFRLRETIVHPQSEQLEMTSGPWSRPRQARSQRR